MIKGIGVWCVWIASMTIGIYSTAGVYNGLVAGNAWQVGYGVAWLLFSFLVAGNLLAVAKRAFRQAKAAQRH